MRRIAAASALLVTMATGALATAAPLAVNGTAATGGEFRLDATRGRIVTITLVSRYTRGELERVNDALKADLGHDTELVTVVDFVGIPHMFQGIARRRVAEASRTTPVQFVVDDCGRWRNALGAAPDKRIDILVLDRTGELRGHFVGIDQVAQARALIKQLRNAI